MLDKIYKFDGGLIKLFQWMIHLLELHTDIERKQVINFFFEISKGLIIMYLFFVIISGILSPSLILFFSLLNVVLIWNFRKIVKDAFLGQTIKVSAFPVEIITRRFLRLYMFFGIIVSTVFLNIEKTLIDFTCLLMIWLFFCIEYLLCTTSLPPGEKQKRKEEKEMKNMVPVPTNH